MKIFKWTSVSLILISCVLFFYCKTESKPKKQDAPAPIDYNAMLEGNWELENAYRNKGKVESKEKVESLDNTRFKFDGQGSISSNFNADGEEQTNTYTIERNMIKQSGKTSFTYLIRAVTDSTLTLITRYRGYNFELELSKWNPENQVQ